MLSPTYEDRGWKRRQPVAPYPCFFCGKHMFATEVIDFKTLNGKPQKHHRQCREAAEGKDA